MSEFEELKESFLQAKYGSFIIFPVKYQQGEIDSAQLDQTFERVPMETMDLSEGVKAMMNGDHAVGVGCCYRIPAAQMKTRLFNGIQSDDQLFAVDDREYPFALWDSFLYVFHTQVAFLCMGITYQSMKALSHIMNSGYAVNSTRFFRLSPEGVQMPVDMDAQITGFLREIGMELFYPNSSAFLEAYLYNLAVVPQRFEKLETIRQGTYNLHAQEPLQLLIEDESEQDLRYVYGKKDQELLRYRWGCCVTSQDISYLVADENMDFESEMQSQAMDGLPIIALILYEKYTCLRFNDLLTVVDRHRAKRISHLKTMMLKFQAYGTVSPANISRWHNIKSIYRDLLEVCEIPDAIEDIDRKINILSEHQMELHESRNQKIAAIFTVVGTVSILDSILSIFNILYCGARADWVVTAVTGILMGVLCFVGAFSHKD